MAEKSRFYDAVGGVPTYSADAWAEWANAMLTKGYVVGYNNQLAVVPDSPNTMSVEVDTGAGWNQGRMYENTSLLNLTIDAAEASTRIDRVVITLNLSGSTYTGVTPNVPDRTMQAAILKGTAGAGAPAIVTGAGSIWMLCLADVTIAPGTVSIDAAKITSQRDNDTLCGKAIPRGSFGTAGGTITGLLTLQGGLAITTTTLVTNLNADRVDSFHAGNASGQIPVSNGTVNTNLNADMLDGHSWPDLGEEDATADLTLTTNFVVIAGTQYTVPSGKSGVYSIRGYFDFDRQDTDTTTCEGTLFVNGSDLGGRLAKWKEQGGGFSGDRATISMEWRLSLVVGNTVQLAARKDTGGTHIVQQENTCLIAQWIKP